MFCCSVIFVLRFFGGITVVTFRAWLGLSFVTPLVLLLIIFAMGAVKSVLRLHAVTSIIDQSEVTSLRSSFAHATLWPFASALYLYNAVAAAMSRRIKWRGITYELISPNETTLLARNRVRPRA